MPLPHDKYFLELADPVARYMHISGRRPDCTPEDILDQATEIWELVSWRFTSLAHLKENDFYLSWDEVPKPYTEGMYVYIRTGRKVERYQMYKGEWINLGDLTDDMYK